MSPRALSTILIGLIVASAIAVYAASVNVVTNVYQAEGGVYYIVQGNFDVSGLGFTVAQSAHSASQQPVPWSSGGVAYANAVTAGHWIYTVQVALTDNTPAGETFTLTLKWNTGSGYQTIASVQFTTPQTIVSGQTMQFVFDTGTTSFNAPATLLITIE